MLLANANKVRRPGAITVIAMCMSGWFAAVQGQAPTGRAAPTRNTIVPESEFCIRGQSIRKCGSFAIIELPIGAAVWLPKRSASPGNGDAHAGLEIGGMVNRSETQAIGGTISAAYSAGDSHFSINARSRTWFSEGTYRDVSLGLLAVGSSSQATAYGITASAGSGYADLIGVWAGADLAFVGASPRVGLRAGARLGSYPTLGVLALGVAALAALATQPLHGY